MALTSIIALVVTVLALAVLLAPVLRRNRAWRATVTPLASIIGSGFLVSAPLLVREVGGYALYAMLGLCAVAYWVGGAVRFNIAHGEPLLENGDAHQPMISLEALSRLALALAYFVSVAFYLLLFATFALKWIGFPDAVAAQVLTTVLLAVIGIAGSFGGLTAVERLEVDAVSVKLAVIAGLVAALAVYAFGHQTPGAAPPEAAFSWRSVSVLLGLLIVIQGFETSRYMGEEYDRATRVRTMRHAQIIATGIYAVFFALVTPLLGRTIEHDGIAAILDVAAIVSPLLPALVTLGALASQFSAATADSIGAAGLLHEISHGRIAGRHAYPAVAFVAILITWTTDVFGMVALASRAFALYYFLQCVIAVLAVRRAPQVGRRAGHQAWYALLAAFCLTVVVFGAPAEGG